MSNIMLIVLNSKGEQDVIDGPMDAFGAQKILDAFNTEAGLYGKMCVVTVQLMDAPEDDDVEPEDSEEAAEAD